MATPATPEQIAARQAEAAIIAGGTPTPPSTSTVTPATTPTPTPTPTAPVVTTAEVRNEFNKNAEKLTKESEKYAYDNILSPNVTGRTTPTTPTPTTPTPVTPPTTPTTPTAGTTPAPVESEYTKTLRDIEAKRKAEFDKMDLAAQERQKLYDQYKATSDDAHKALLDNVRTAFEQTRARMVDTNSRFNNITRQNQYLINGFRYTPQQAEGMVYDTEQAGLSRLAEIDLKYADALQKAQTAKDEKDYKNLNDLMTNLDNLAKDRATALRDMATGAAEIEKSLNNVENMTQPQADVMNSMMEGFGIESESVPADKREEWYKEKAKEISEATGTDISSTFVRSQISRYNRQAQLEAKTPDLQMSEMYGMYVNKKGEPILKDGKPITYNPGDKTVIDQKTGQMLIVGKDEYGNPTIQAVDIPGFRTDSEFVGGAVTGDLRGSAWVSKFPREASIKNNNPAGITFSQGFADRLTQAGIPFEKGTPRPANEGGNYFGFPTIEAGFEAYDLLWNSPSYTGLTLEKALNRWNTGSTEKGYGSTISKQVGIDGNTKVSDLTPEQLRSVQMAQIKRESPGLFQALSSPTEETIPLSPEAMAVVDGTAKIADIPSADRVRILREINTNGKQIIAQKTIQMADRSIKLIQEIKDSPGYKGAVGRGSIAKGFGFKEVPVVGTPAYDTWKLVEALKAQLSIPGLENMRGLGAMSEKEFTAMKDSQSSLDTNLSEKGFAKELDNIINNLTTMKNRNNTNAPSTTPTATGKNTLSDGTTYTVEN